MKTMTLEQALEHTYQQWRYIYENKLDTKPGTNFLYDCACCEYVVQKMYGPDHTSSYSMLCKKTKGSKINCLKHCPLKDLWPYGCEAPGSVYYRWEDGGDNDSAKVISDFAKKKLEAL